MPYIITTYPQDQEIAVALEYGTGRRRAVATLEEARQWSEAMAVRVPGYTSVIGFPTDGAIRRALPESGGTVGPLPDGTVIEVAPMVNAFGRPDARGYLQERGWHLPRSLDEAEIIDAYNAAQG